MEKRKLRGMASQIYRQITKDVNFFLQMDFLRNHEDAESEIPVIG